MTSSRPPSDASARDVVWDAGVLPRQTRERLLGQRGCTIWLTGISGSGKSTIAAALERALVEQGRLAYRLDGDNLRHGLNSNLGFSREDRAENVRRAGEVCRLLADVGAIVIATFVSPFVEDRERCRRIHAEAGVPFLEVHVHCPLAVAEARDPKGLYARARRGEIRDFTGVGQGYEPPTAPDLAIDTSRISVPEAVASLQELLARRGG